VIEQADEEVDYQRLSTKELVVLASRGDEDATRELERRDSKKRAAAGGSNGLQAV
jgi:hypothetical protein